MPREDIRMSPSTILSMVYVVFALATVLMTRIVVGMPRLSLVVLTYWQYAFVSLCLVTALIAFMLHASLRQGWEMIVLASVLPGVWYMSLFLFPFPVALSVAAALTLLGVGLHHPWGVWACLAMGLMGFVVNLTGWLPFTALIAGVILILVHDFLSKSAQPERLIVVPFFQSTIARLPMSLGSLVFPLCLICYASFRGMRQGIYVCLGLCLAILTTEWFDVRIPARRLAVHSAGVLVAAVLLQLLGRV